MAYRGLRGLRKPAAGDRGTSTGARIRHGLILGGGVALLTTGLAGDSPVLIFGLGGLGLTITFWAFKRLAPPGTLRAKRGYPTAILLRGVVTFAFFTIDTYVALLLVEVRGWSAAGAGIALTAATVSWTMGSWTQARLSGRIPHERFVRVGFPVVAVGIALLGLILIPEVPAWLAVPIFGLGGFGMGLTYAQFALIVLRDVPHESQGEITAGLTMSDTLGTALGLSVSAAFVAASYRSAEGAGPGIAAAIVAGTIAAVIGWALAPRLHRTAEVTSARQRATAEASGTLR
jgi:predicted MFS family arabinose efflux permease